MLRRICFLLLLGFLLGFVGFFAVTAHAQTENTFKVKGFAGPGARDVGTMTRKAQAACDANHTIPCVLIFDPTLAAFAAGSMPAKNSWEVWKDYTGKFGGESFSALAVGETILNPAPFSRFFSGDLSTKKVVLWGNSTVYNMTTLHQQLASHAAAGKELEGITATPEVLDGSSMVLREGNIYNYGNGGFTLSQMLSGAAPFSISRVIAAKPDLLIIRGPLINDVRGGACDLACAVGRLKSALDQITVALPNTDILLMTENSLLTTDVGAHGYVVPNSSAQAYTSILEQAVMSFAGKYANLTVLDLQSLQYGTVAPSSSSLMADQLHPSTDGQTAEADLIAKVLGKFRHREPIEKASALTAGNLPAGSAAAPSLTFGVANTGFFGGDVNHLYLSFGGAPKFTFAQNGLALTDNASVVQFGAAYDATLARCGANCLQSGTGADGTFKFGQILLDNAASLSARIGVLGYNSTATVAGFVLDNSGNPTNKVYLKLMNGAGTMVGYIDPSTGSVEFDGDATFPAIKATTGTRYVCVNTSGKLVSQASACSGT